MARPAKASAPQLLLVPTEVAWAFTAERGWHTIARPPAWWMQDQEEMLADDEQPRAALSLVPALPVSRTSCRPGTGPCRRRHEHTSPRRAAA